MEKEFIPYKIALALKEIGFDEKCFGFYENEILKPTSYVNDFNNGTNHNVDFDNVFRTIKAPTFSQAFRWFREVYNIYVEISFNQKYENPRFGYIVRTKSTCFHTRDFPYKTYEEALEIGLQEGLKLIEIVKEK